METPNTLYKQKAQHVAIPLFDSKKKDKLQRYMQKDPPFFVQRAAVVLT